MAESSTQVDRLVEHLFRHQAGRIVTTLTKILGVDHLELAEDVVQETLLKALRHWPFSGAPQNPAGWILQTAKNSAIDVLRRAAIFRGKEEQIRLQIERELNSDEDDKSGGSDFKSDQLRMMFVCCHPGLAREAQVALTLKTLSGFSVAEIARAFLAEEATVAQRLVRAKRKLREEMVGVLQVPEGRELRERLGAVLEVLYLLFNEGYNAHLGEDLIREDLCFEALRLTELLAEHPLGNRPKVHALLAIMWFQASRLPGRVDREGNVLLLSEQDRTKWDQNMIHRGFYHLEQAGHGTELTEYHLEAGIASCHALAPGYAETDWRLILSYYDQLAAMNHSPVVALNRAVALAMVEGPEAGILALEKISNLPPMKSYYLFPATLAEFHVQMRDFAKAAASYRQALALAGTDPERRFLSRKLKEAEQAEVSPLRVNSVLF
jgi:RNA polymerase sigma-70 factor (ECF subfamily)